MNYSFSRFLTLLLIFILESHCLLLKFHLSETQQPEALMSYSQKMHLDDAAQQPQQQKSMQFKTFVINTKQIPLYAHIDHLNGSQLQIFDSHKLEVFGQSQSQLKGNRLKVTHNIFQQIQQFSSENIQLFLNN